MRKLLFGVVVLLTVLIAAVFIIKPVKIGDLDFGFGSKKAKETTQSLNLVDNKTNEAPEFLDLNTKGRVCSQDAKYGDYTQITQISVKQGKLRADIKTIGKNGEESTSAHMVNKDGFVYVWEENKPVGIRFSESEYTNEDKYNPLGAIDYTALKMAATVDANCLEKELSDDTFALPKWIEFKEFKIDVSGIQEKLAEYCKQCDSAPDEETKNSCKNALGCE